MNFSTVGIQFALGGPDVFKNLGVPGFAAGGLVPEPDTSRLDMLNLGDKFDNLSNKIQRIEVVLDMHKVRDANDELDVILETTGI